VWGTHATETRRRPGRGNTFCSPTPRILCKSVWYFGCYDVRGRTLVLVIADAVIVIPFIATPPTHLTTSR
jgi:hypothetical protein